MQYNNLIEISCIINAVMSTLIPLSLFFKHKQIKMTRIKTKRVYEDYEESDGYRILVDKLWPRGIKKEDLKLDLWAKNITPSTDLRKWFHEDTENRFDEFSVRYLIELRNSDTVKDFIQEIKSKDVVTLLYASKNKELNHAIVLKKYIESQLVA